MSRVIMIVMAALLAGFVYAEVTAIRRWKGVWRLAAALPGMAMGVMVLIDGISILRDPTSHNLWPFEAIMWTGGGLTFLGILKSLKSFGNRNQ